MASRAAGHPVPRPIAAGIGLVASIPQAVSGTVVSVAEALPRHVLFQVLSLPARYQAYAQRGEALLGHAPEAPAEDAGWPPPAVPTPSKAGGDWAADWAAAEDSWPDEDDDDSPAATDTDTAAPPAPTSADADPGPVTSRPEGVHPVEPAAVVPGRAETDADLDAAVAEADELPPVPAALERSASAAAASIVAAEEDRERPVEAGLVPAASDLPFADFDGMTMGSLRARMRPLTLSQLEDLIAYERAHARRLQILTLLENRRAKLRENA